MRGFVVVAILILAGCAGPKKFYDGAERDPAEVARLQVANGYVYSVNKRRTNAEKDPAPLLILPGTQRLIVQLDEDMASRYGRVGVHFVFCARAGHGYTVYPVTDPVAKLWEPAAKDDATLVDVPAAPCAGDVDPVATREPESAPVVPTPVAPAPVVPAPVPPVVATPQIPPPAPKAAVAAASVPPGVLVAGGQARLRASARTRSIKDAPVVKGLEPGLTVTLKVVLKKDTGAWWYVNAGAASGWVRDVDLEPVAP